MLLSISLLASLILLWFRFTTTWANAKEDGAMLLSHDMPVKSSRKLFKGDKDGREDLRAFDDTDAWMFNSQVATESGKVCRENDDEPVCGVQNNVSNDVYPYRWTNLYRRAKGDKDEIELEEKRKLWR